MESHSPLDLVDPSWLPALEPHHERLNQITKFLQRERAEGHQILPAPHHILRAFSLPVDRVRVLIVGQDPYPTPGHAMGLAFATAPQVSPLPASLRNICKELASDVGTHLMSGDLTHWESQGVLLLNRCLTVRAGEAGSHHGIGWESITESAISHLGRRRSPLVAILWGRAAQQLGPKLEGHPVLAAPHPSPLSAYRGFFGSRPFSQTNSLLSDLGADPIDW